MKLYCKYSSCQYGKKRDDNHPPMRQCDFCKALLCHICGYTSLKIDYCNECWVQKLKEEDFERTMADRERAWSVDIKDKLKMK